MAPELPQAVGWGRSGGESGSQGVAQSSLPLPTPLNPPEQRKIQNVRHRGPSVRLGSSPCHVHSGLRWGQEGGDECWGTPSVPLLTCPPFCTPSPVPGGWGTCLVPCGMRGTQQQGELQSDRKTGAAGSRAGSGLSQRGTPSCRVLAQQSLPSAGARRRSPRSEPTLGPVSPTGVLAPPHRGTSPPLPRCPKPR